MQENTVEKALQNFGLTEKETEIYIYLAKHGIQKGVEIAKKTRTAKAVVYRILKILHRKGFVESTLQSPVRFKAVPFETILDIEIKAKHEEAHKIENAKKELLNDWGKISRGEPESPVEKIVVLEGNQKIYSKMYQMVKQTKDQLSIIATIPGILRSDRYGITNEIISHPLKKQIKFRFLTDITNADHNSIQFIKKKLRTGADLRGRNPELGLKPFPRMIIRDQKEILFFITPNAKQGSSKTDETCLCTNCKSIIQAFSIAFENLWQKSVDLGKKIGEIETGKSTQTTELIKDSVSAEKIYLETLSTAKKEILIVTSSKGLARLLDDKSLLKQWRDEGIKIKAMSPITGENLNIAHQLMDFCEVRHIPTGYLETTIIDGCHLFQFKNFPEDAKLREDQFANTFYTNDTKYVEKTKIILDSIWRQTRAPSSQTLESITRPYSPRSSVSIGKKTHSAVDRVRAFQSMVHSSAEKENVLNTYYDGETYPVGPYSEDNLPVITRYFGTTAFAIIHPPNSFGLPDFIIGAWCLNEKSSFGAENYIVFYLPSKLSIGSYAPMVNVSNNSHSYLFKKHALAGLSEFRNDYQIVKRNELQLRLQGNSFFVGWTVPINFTPLKYVLPPCCILFEGYGDVRSGSFTHSIPSGRKNKVVYNCIEAFVTFFHPSSKYSGPGTEGFIDREMVYTSYPKETS